MAVISDPVRMYLKEIGRVALLNGPDEVALAKRIEAGVAARAELATPAARAWPRSSCAAWRPTARTPSGC